jgi:hypothetical protein
VPPEHGAPAEPKTTWLTPYADAWVARGGHFVGSREARALKQLETEYGAAEVLRRWCRMLDRVSELRFASAALLLRAWGDYADELPPPARGVAFEEPEAMTARLRANLQAETPGGAHGARA